MEERHFTEQDRSLAIAFSNHVALVLQQVMMTEKERQIEIATSLQQLSETLAAVEDFNGLLNSIVEAAVHLLRAAGAILYLLDESGLENAVAAGAGIAERVKGMQTSYGQNIRTRFPTEGYIPYHRPRFDLSSAAPSPILSVTIDGKG